MNKQADNTGKMLLSLAVFKKLYDEQKDIYEVISSFIKCELSTQTTPFKLIDITKKVNTEYSFYIPQAVIKTSLNKIKKKGFLKFKDGEYVIIKKITVPDVENDSRLAEQQKQNVLNTIKQYLDAKNFPYKNIEKSLENYILNKHDEISIHIDACVIKNSNNKSFVDNLNEIKYGLVLYKGISYGMENINPENWNPKTIFLDTAILFYLAGYQGGLFEQMANDFLLLIETTNRKKEIIKLRFLESAEKQIDNIFYTAEQIISRKKNYHANELVKHILSSCHNGSSSDIAIKKIEFYSFLSQKKIKLYEENTKSNLESGDLDLDDKGLERQKQLSFINILRGSKKFNTLDKVDYLFLTQTHETIEISMRHRKEERGFPLALRLFDLTNQLWIKTNQGLGNDKLPATFDIRNKAKIALSASLAKGVFEEYEKIYKQHEKQEIDENALIDKVAELRKIETSPDEINEENCEEIENIIINPESLNRYYEEKAFDKQQLEEKENIIKDQDSKIKTLEQDNSEEKENIIKEYESKIKILEQDKTKTQIFFKKIVKIVFFIFVATTLYYFSDNLSVYLGKYGETIIDVMSALSFAFAFLTFFGISFKTIKLQLKKFKKNYES
jgi:hypothetical protein